MYVQSVGKYAKIVYTLYQKQTCLTCWLLVMQRTLHSRDFEVNESCSILYAMKALFNVSRLPCQHLSGYCY